MHSNCVDVIVTVLLPKGEDFKSLATFSMPNMGTG